MGVHHPDLPPKPGYYLAGFCKSFWHKWAKKRIYAPPGKAFHIWRKIA